ncbi:MAG: RIP metalloprotease RseP [Planctomycetes bacterium]|nr:RIP metalloprotease RseP [Planctomycetota bacterium]
MPELTVPPVLAAFADFLDTTLHVLVVVLGIGLLIFVHELGHFLVAKWNKVRVEAFSLGFGPVLFGFRRGDTHYRLSLIPLGGYVKMAGETPTDEHSSDPAEFQNKSIRARFSILIAGVTMNAILGVFLFVFAFNVGVPLPSPVVGATVPGSPAWKAGILPADRILMVDGTQVIDFQDIMEEIAFSRGSVDIVVSRDGRTVSFEDLEPVVDPSLGARMVGLQGRYELSVEENSAAYAAGFRSGDVPLRVQGLRTEGPAEVLAALQASEGPVTLTVRRGTGLLTVEVSPVAQASEEGPGLIGITSRADRIAFVRTGSPAEAAGFRAGDALVRVDGAPVRDIVHARRLVAGSTATPPVVTVLRDGIMTDLALPDPVEAAEGGGDLFRDLAAAAPAAADTRVLLLPDRDFEGGNPARAAGLTDGAVIRSVNGHPVTSFLDIVARIAETERGAPVVLTFEDELGLHGPVQVHRRPHLERTVPGLAFATSTEVRRVPGIASACYAGLRRSLLTGRRILQFIGGIFTGRVSAQNLSGPVAIAQISYSAARKNFVYFLYFLGLLSINLAILNILPIPILDGGHILFLVIEAIRRRPLPVRAMAILQWVGLVFLLLLMAFVITNDVTR